MATAVVHQFEVFDVTTDAFVRSTRLATQDAIDGIPGARVVAGTALEVDAAELDSDIEGMSAKGRANKTPQLAETVSHGAPPRAGEYRVSGAAEADESIPSPS